MSGTSADGIDAVVAELAGDGIGLRATLLAHVHQDFKPSFRKRLLAAALHGTLEAFAREKGLGLGKVAQPLRVAVTGGTISPPIDQTLTLLGQTRSLARLQAVTR